MALQVLPLPFILYPSGVSLADVRIIYCRRRRFYLRTSAKQYRERLRRILRTFAILPPAGRRVYNLSAGTNFAFFNASVSALPGEKRILSLEIFPAFTSLWVSLPSPLQVK